MVRDNKFWATISLNLYLICFSHPLLSSGLQVKMPSPPPQPLHILTSVVIRKQGVEVPPVPAPFPIPAPAPVPVPAHPASAAIMAQRVEGRNAEADHRVVPDTLAGMSHKF